MRNFNSKIYWEERYSEGGNSGYGSKGDLYKYKISFINNFINQYQIQSIGDFGCGDGLQIKEINPVYYTGYDISPSAIKICKSLFYKDPKKKFILYENYKGETYDLSLSLDVIYHLVEEEIFQDYMMKLFAASKKYIIIYSSNGDILEKSGIHIYDRNFTKWIEKNFSNFHLIKKEENPFKYIPDISDPLKKSISDFYIYKK